MTVALAIVDEELAPAVLALRPRPDQERFSGTPAQTLRDAGAVPGRVPITVLEDGTPVGFFILDADPVFAAHTGYPHTLGVRAFFIDRDHQGRGLGVAALRALPAFVAEHHPAVTHLALTVNLANPVAVRAYRRAGWSDTGRIDHSGGAGPQHVMALAL